MIETLKAIDLGLAKKTESAFIAGSRLVLTLAGI